MQILLFLAFSVFLVLNNSNADNCRKKMNFIIICVFCRLSILHKKVPL